MKWRQTSLIRQCSSLFKNKYCVYCLTVKRKVSLSYKIIVDEKYIDRGPPILILHGLLGSRKHWKSIGKTLRNVTKRLVVNVDLRNHGRSPHDDSHKYEQLADDVMQLLQKLNISSTCLIGHNMGGKTAMYMALTKPKVVDKLLVVDVSPISTSPDMNDFLTLMKAMKSVKFNTAKEEDARNEAKEHLNKIIKDDKAMWEVLSNVRKNSKVDWICNLDALIKHFDHIAAFPNVKGLKYLGPTLFIGGQMSTHIPPDDLNPIRELFPMAVIHYIPKTGHYLHVDEPRTFLEHTIRFLKVKDIY